MQALVDRQLDRLVKQAQGDFSVVYRERIEVGRNNPGDDIYPATWSHTAAREFNGCGLLFPEEWKP
jgi:hypothetical protein